MAKKTGSPLGRWSIIIVIVLLSLVASGAMLQAMGIIDAGAWIMTRLERHPALSAHAHIYRLGLETEEAIERERARIDELVARLEEERAAVEAERESLRREWAAIERERAMLDQRARQLQVLQENLDARAARFEDFERLQELYNGMRASELLPILEQLEDGTVARILSGMDDRKVAQVLAAMEPSRAAALSRLMGGISAKER